MRYFPRLDRKQKEIVEHLREHGKSVRSTAGLGAGFPDLIVGCHRGNVLIEVEDPKRKANKREATRDAEKSFRDRWAGPVYVIDTKEQALAAVEAYERDASC